MLRKTLIVCLFVGCFSFATVAAIAQQVVHALSGTVNSINTEAKTIEIDTNDGSAGLFRVIANPSVSLHFDKDVRADATDADAFTKKGAEVIVYYYGGAFAERTAVALQDLGPGPLENKTGTIVKFDKHQHLLIVKTESGSEESFRIDDKTIAETSVGAVEGHKFDPEKGNQVRVIATAANGSNTALFVRAD